VTFDALASALTARPRVPLALQPTPLEDAVRLREALGGRAACPRILVKRDDLTGLGLGGNKARKLEFLMGEALAERATTVVTTGAVQSNHARMTAAAARRCGLGCDLVLTATDESPAIEGNLLLDRLFDARVHFVPAVDPMFAVGQDEAVVARLVDEQRMLGGRPYVIPVGGSSATGALGYVAGTLELARQLAALGVSPRRVYYASGSRGTQAGLTLGAHLLRMPYELYGVAVSAGEPEKIERARRAAREAAAVLGEDDSVTGARFFTDQAFIGNGYGIPSEAGVEALRLAARTEALVLDLAYTSKAFAALVAHVRSGELAPTDTVVFLHTGGSPATLTTRAAAHLAAAAGWQNS